MDEAHRFIDLDIHWAASLIQKAVCEEIVKGYPDGTFKPNVSITRAEFTIMLANALIWEESEAIPNTSKQCGGFTMFDGFHIFMPMSRALF